MTNKRSKTITILFCMMLFSLSALSVPNEACSQKTASEFAVPVETVLRKYRNDWIFLVDVRLENAYQTVRIPGSLNVPLHAVKTKPFLKTKPIVLVNDGYADLLLEKECRRLKDKGFNAVFLTGGLNAWQHKKGPLEGDLIAAKAFSTVSAQTYYQEKAVKNTIVIDISDAQDDTTKALMPDAIQLPTIGRLAKQPVNTISASDLAAVVSDLKKMPNDALLITNRDGEGYASVEKIIEAAELGPVFYLEGGRQAYRRFLDQLALSRLPMKQRIKTINECEPCGQVVEVGSTKKK